MSSVGMKGAVTSGLTTYLWEARIRLGVVVKDAAVGSRVQQGGVVVSGWAAGAL